MKIKTNLAFAATSTTVRPGRVRLFLGAVLLGLAVTGSGRVIAQAPGAPMNAARLPDKHYLTKNVFTLPVNIDERARPGIREVHLYVREGPGGAWMLKDKALPNQSGFNSRLMHDGEYWFSVVTIDLAGKATPVDVNAEPPGIIVVLDTQRPQVELKPLPPCADGLCIRCEVADANPNPMQTKFEFQTADQVWRTLEPMPNQPECFCVPRQAVLTGMVRVSCMDRAQNLTVREITLASLGTAATPPATAQHQEPSAVAQAGNFEKAGIPAQQSHYPPAGSAAESAKAPVITPSDLSLVGTEIPVLPPDMPVPTPSLPTIPACETVKKTPTSGKWLLVNNPRVNLAYRIEDEGKSGVGKVEVWMTKDGGQTWDVLCDDPDRQSPVEFTLPGEGVYGLRLVASNGRGFGAMAPKAGDAPEFVVEVDSTKPHTELLTIKLGPTSEAACVDINWLAVDKNFGPGPIELYYSVHAHGPWTPIAKNVPNAGKYRWFLPAGIGREAYIRLVATDVAGNSNRCEMTEAIALDDNSRPQARIVGITPTSDSPTGH